MRLEVSLAGRFALVHDGATNAGDGLGRLGRLMLACLVSERRRIVTRDELAEVLWGDDLPRTWETSLRVVVSKLRAALVDLGLPAGLVATAPGGYRLELPDGAVVEVDVEQADEALVAAEVALSQDRATEAALLAGSAATVAARPFLGGEGGAWAERRQAELRALRLRALLVVADAALAAGDPGTALVAAEQAVVAEPFREAAHERVMAAHGAAGNRAEGLRAYERCRRLLADELGVPPSRAVQAAYEQLLLDDDEMVPRPAAVPPPRRRPLPVPSTSFVGRGRELADINDLLRAARLVTLVGTGGVGKTRLALEVAAEVDQPVLVELGAVTGPRAVPQEVMAALGLREQPGLDPTASLVGHLGDRVVLVVLDKCEHVVEQCAALAATLLASCPGVSFLATSREPLRVGGEITWRVPSLSPAEAVTLFGDRARSARPDLDWNHPPPAVAQVCRRLDGIPLALELAAARTRALSVEEIAHRLDDRFRLLAGGDRSLPARHRTLRAVVDWTYDALPPGEARLFDRLSVFAGGFPAEAAEQVCGAGELDPGEVLVLLAALVDRSLVVAESTEGTRTRYRLLETLQQYGAERLAGSPEGPALRDRHLAWAMELAGEADAQLGGPDQGQWLEALELAHDDVRAALVWAAEVSPEAALRLSSDLGRFWEIRGHLTSGRSFLTAALAAVAPVASPSRARALDWAGIMAQQQGDYPEAESHFQAGLAVHRALGHDRGVAAWLHGLGNLAALRG
ncbi:MAG: BTAD domain-containing putative transcriptional regulator, partial [Acidimicrobiales bacterium]